MKSNSKGAGENINEELSALTPRELEIFKMLLNGVMPKEIAHSLNISYNTFKTHQKNLYQKLSVHTIRDLAAKYQAEPAGEKPEEADTTAPVIFTRWFENIDKFGSNVIITEQVEYIDKKYFPTITIAGRLSPVKNSYAGIFAIPHPSTLKLMRKMERFSFKVLGDGNSYAVTIPTTDTRLKGEYNHYRKLITVKNGEISVISIKVDELTQVPYWGNPVPFIKNNIEFFQIHAYATNEFTLKFWDIRFFSD